MHSVWWTSPQASSTKAVLKPTTVEIFPLLLRSMLLLLMRMTFRYSDFHKCIYVYSPWAKGWFSINLWWKSLIVIFWKLHIHRLHLCWIRCQKMQHSVIIIIIIINESLYRIILQSYLIYTILCTYIYCYHRSPVVK